MSKLKTIDLKIDLEADHSPLDITFGELIALYLAAIPCNGQSRPFRVRKWITAFGDLPAWQLTTAHVAALVERLEDASYKASTINREVTDIRSAYSWAMKRRKAPEGFINPCSDYEPKTEAIRRVELSDEDIEALLAAAKLSRWRKLYTLVLMALHTGGRKGELMALTWEDIDFDARRALLHQTKSGKPRTLQLTPAVVTALRAIQPSEIQAGYVFCGKNLFKPHDFRAAWLTCRSLAGFDELHFHDLRHVAAAKLLKRGTNLLAVTQILGHVDTRMISRRYGHLDDQHLLEAVDQTWTT